ncbi:MAG: hypothetical protein IPJ76_04640 [Flavobacteriales bacterium]|nr:MAG: hypothetical protein IPJ76_04640 [Flavobacteriales bacterium]
MKNVLTIIATILVVGGIAFGLNWILNKAPEKPTKQTAQPSTIGADSNKPPADLVMGDPLTDSGLQFDGVYHATMDDIHYYMRFFPAGHVAMVGGPERDDKTSLRTMLTASVLSQRNIGLYNIPVQLRGDSVYMTAHGPKGDIEYRSRISDGKLDVLKQSKANGKKANLAYVFEADPS